MYNEKLSNYTGLSPWLLPELRWLGYNKNELLRMKFSDIVLDGPAGLLAKNKLKLNEYLTMLMNL